jgi:hypothetical protein
MHTVLKSAHNTVLKSAHNTRSAEERKFSDGARKVARVRVNRIVAGRRVQFQGYD